MQTVQNIPFAFCFLLIPLAPTFHLKLSYEKYESTRDFLRIDVAILHTLSGIFASFLGGRNFRNTVRGVEDETMEFSIRRVRHAASSLC
jgi:hypothetical protein